MRKKISTNQASIREERIKGLQNYFPMYVPHTNRNEKIIKCSELIDWDSTLFLFDVVIDDLLKKIDIPDDYEDPAKLKKIFRGAIFSFLQIQYYQLIIVGWNDPQNKKDSVEQFHMIQNVQEYAKREIERIVEVIKSLMDYSLLKPIHYYEKLSLKKKELQLEIEEIKPSSEHGKKFSGKKNRKYEIPAYKKVEQKYNQLKKEGFNPKYRSIAINIARIELELIHEREQVNFYNRFLQYKKPKK